MDKRTIEEVLGEDALTVIKNNPDSLLTVPGIIVSQN